MTPGGACCALIKRFEELRLEAYPDPATGAEPWTIGWGHTGPEVHEGLVISEGIADAYLVKDMQDAVEAVNALVKVDMTQGQFDALVSFVFNCGAGNFAKSTMLKKMNEGDTVKASLEILKWNRGDGKVMNGLVRRRAAEQSLFLS